MTSFLVNFNKFLYTFLTSGQHSIRFLPKLHFYTFWKFQKISFSNVLGGIEMEHWHEIHPIFYFYTPWKCQNLWFSGVFRVYRIGKLAWNGCRMFFLQQLIGKDCKKKFLALEKIWLLEYLKYFCNRTYFLFGHFL